MSCMRGRLAPTLLACNCALSARPDLTVSNLCLGTMQFGWTANEQQAFAVMDAFVEAGGNFIDTADVYSSWAPGNPGGVSEEIIGRWMKARGNRDNLVVATKVRGRMWEGPDGEGPEPRAHHARRRGQPPPPPGRHDRPLPVPLARREDADRGDARRSSASLIPPGRSATSAPRTSPPRSSRKRSRSPGRRACRASRRCSRTTTSSTATSTRPSSPHSASAKTSASSRTARSPPASSPASTAPASPARRAPAPAASAST